MGKFNINAEEFIKFLKDAGAKVTKAPEGEEGGFFINGKRVDPVEILRESFNTPITCEECEDKQ